MLQQGARYERYQILSTVGEGGMAVVYRARHAALGSLHALKVMNVCTDEARERLMEEGRVQAKLQHPNLVPVNDVIDVEDRLALVMDYVDGPSLYQWMHHHEPELDHALEIFHGILQGVRAVHRSGLIHRDLKPANVLLDHCADGSLLPRVTDFGLVQTTGTDVATRKCVGTPHYMAPERLQAQPDLDERVDLFSLGCILYELTTGAPPFVGGDLIAVTQAVCAGDYPDPRQVRPDLPPPVAATIHHLLQPDRDLRLGSCDEVLRILYGSTGPAVPPWSGSRWERASTASVESLAPTAPVPLPERPRRDAPEPVAASQLRGAFLTGGAGVLLGAATTIAFLIGLVGARFAPGWATTTDEVAAATHALVRQRSLAEVGTAPASGSEPGEATPVAPGTPAHGEVLVTGDAEVVLDGPERQVGSGELAPGAYEVVATFDGVPVDVGTLAVEAGQLWTVRCTSFAMGCNFER